ncbi:glucuronyl esterase domain-containing protein [Pleomorphovibrio marinus]|uniref:glucuronyl esterase domain-containing protein n=1 Tax=Pleomorphovibrio marinus TaxID=2164132 RepID=UPI000E0B7988|nr:acetylxylan esterase [Pleomorphovibrio marinus]
MRLIFLLCLLLPLQTLAQDFVPNYDEGKVPDYQLPDPLVLENGESVNNQGDWEKRRKEILGYFEREVYGKSPEWDGEIEAEVVLENDNAVNGKAHRKEVKLTLKREGKKAEVFVLIYHPKNNHPAPFILGLNFYGNHTLSEDPSIRITDAWIRNNETYGSANNRASEKGRGKRRANWAVEEAIERGYGIATLYYGELDPDFDDGFRNGVHALYEEERNESSWGAVAAWAWGLSRVMDYLETLEEVDAEKVAVLGHSRLGKAALWAGATDTRFGLVISNNSGSGGVALSRRRYGETVGRINRVYGYWFAERFSRYSENEDELPIDQHQLIALMAPRPVYIASAVDDQWADPKGEFFGGLHANPAYQLFGKTGMPSNQQPQVDQPVMGDIGYHLRSGGHGMLPYDMQQYFNFADKHWKGK